MTHHKLIHAASERVLSDSKTILEENIQDQGKEAMRRSPRSMEPVSQGHPQGTFPNLDKSRRTRLTPFFVVLFLIKSSACAGDLAQW